jgi:hypothetical protein
MVDLNLTRSGLVQQLEQLASRARVPLSTFALPSHSIARSLILDALHASRDEYC